jgi:hypothetical protein
MRSTTAALFAALLLPAAVFGQICTKLSTGPTPPLAVDDMAYVSAAGTPIVIPVLANDVVSGSGSLSIINVSVPPKGTAVKNDTNNTITYTPNTLSDDSFTYTIIDTTLQDSPSSTATVHILPQTGFPITVECHGGDCLFDAHPASLDGIKSFTWNHGDGTTPGVGWTRSFHQYHSEGFFTTTVRADYYSGATAEGTIGVSIVFQKALVWTINGTTNGTGELGVSVNVDTDSLRTFSGGIETAQVSVSLGDSRSDCVYICGSYQFMSCFPYCQFVADAYWRTGTYAVRVRVKDGNNQVWDYARYNSVVNHPPVPAFTSVRDTQASWSYTFDPHSSTDEFGIDSDPGLAPGPYEWDFGDGMTGTNNGPAKITHLYAHPGTFTVGLRLTDPGGEDGFTTRTITVADLAPVPKIRVNCKLLDCTFGVEGSADDGNDIRTWQWDFGDATTGSGQAPAKHYNAAGCYNVILTATDGAGGAGVATLTVPVGPPLFAKAGGAVVDAHVQSYQQGASRQTSNGNLNGILEPGETAVIEPQWHATASAVPVSVLAQGLTSTDYAYANPVFRDFATAYDLSTGTSDCWTSGRCYVIELQSNPLARNTSRLHNDITFNETYASTGQPTPGSPIAIHVGGSYTDVASTDWAYPYIESVLHFGIDAGCGNLRYCPGTPVTRAQAAQYLLKAEHGAAYTPPPCTADPFTDVSCGRVEAPWIQQLKAEGLAAGTTYSPDANLTRGDMTVFVLKAKNGASYTPPACQWDFGDAPCPNHPLSAWISEAKRRGISNGCLANEYCPDETVDRAQAASFIARTWEINLATKQCNPAAFDNVQGHQPRPPIESLVFDPSPVVMGNTSTGTLTLGLATQFGVTVPLSIDNPSAATIPPNVFVPAGVRSAAFAVKANTVAVRTPTFITASYLNATKTTELDVCTPPPTISAQPTSRIIYAGTSTTLTVTASGGGTLTYQWYQGNAPSTATPVGTNSPNLTVTPAQTMSYWVNITNACSSTASATATVTVCYLPTVTTQPQSDIIVSGTSATLSVTAGGSAPFSYQWYEGASGTTTTPVGTNSATFTTPSLTANKSYWVRVTSTCNGPASVDSATAAITVVTSVTRRQTAAAAVQSLTSVTTNWTRPTQAGSLLVAAMSASHNATPVGAITAPAGWQLAVTYEWNNVKTAIYYYPNNPGGRTTETFAMPSFRDQTLQLAEYVAAVAASPLDRTAFDGDFAPHSGSVSSGTTITTSQPREVLVSALAINTATAFSAPDNAFVEVQDQVAGNTLTGALHERIVTSAGAYGHNASVGSGPGGSAQWIGAIATFKSLDPAAACTTAPTVTVQPTSRTINPGQSTTLTVTASGQGILAYQWYQGTAPSTATPVGTNSSSLTVTPSATTSYWISISNACGSVASTTATVTVCNLAAISAQPTSRTINAGSPTTLSVTATGGTPLNYQWYQGTAPSTTTPVGTNSSNLTVTPSATTSYWVNVTNSCSSAASATATVTVCNPPTIAAQPQSQSITTGATATLSVTAGGSGPFSYQWYEGASGTTTTPVGTNSSSFTTPVLTANKSYWVRVTSTCNGTATANSNTATVTVTSSSQIVRRQSAGAAVQSLTSVTTNWTQPTQGGSLLVAVVSATHNAYPIATFGFAPGWQLAVSYEWNNIKTSIYYYPNNPGGRTSETVSVGTNNFRDMVLEIAEYTGIATASPLDRTQFNGDGTSTGTLSTGNVFTTSQPKELLISAMSINTATSFSAPDNLFVEIQDLAGGNTLTSAMHERIVASAGAYGHSATAVGNAQWVAMIATFKSATP